jgi:hypothetical protein
MKLLFMLLAPFLRAIDMIARPPKAHAYIIEGAVQRGALTEAGPGSVFYVNSVTGSNSNNGQSWLSPVATIDYAIGLCTADKGDVIYVAPMHAETISAAAGIVCDIAGVTIIGLGTGSFRPTITFTTATTADLDIDAANVTIRNLRFICAMAALAAPIDVNAASFTMEDCTFLVSAAANHPLIVVLTDANANHMAIRRCRMLLEYDNAVTPLIITTARTVAIRLVGADYAVIEDNHIEGNFTVACIDSLTTACRGVSIKRNSLRNVQTTNIAGLIDLVAATTGVVAHNVGFHGYTTDIATVIDPASCAMVENYVSNVVTETGGLVGTPST